jgi:hypothetical protein
VGTKEAANNISCSRKEKEKKVERTRVTSKVNRAYPLSPPVLLFFKNPARTFWEGIIFGSSVVELTLGIIFCLGPF